MAIDSNTMHPLSEGHPLKEVSIRFVELLDKHYQTPLRESWKKKPTAGSPPGFLIAPEKMAIYVGRKHVAVEYFGAIDPPPSLPELVQVEMHNLWDEADFVASIVGMQFQNTGATLELQSTVPTLNFFIPTGYSATEKMIDNGWDFTAEDMAFFMNCRGVRVPEKKFARLINCFFYAEEKDRLRTRHIRWLDFFPLSEEDETETEVTLAVGLWPNLDYTIQHDLAYQYPRPRAFEPQKLAALNRFRELILEPSVAETRITSWLELENHQFIIKMALGSVGVLGQRECEWLDGSGRDALKPDFFAIAPNGYADIVEFKLPELKGSLTVGSKNRETFSAELNSYISQTRVYRDYFQDPRHRKHVSDKHGVRVEHPRRILVLGRRWEFSGSDWRTIKAEHPDLTFLTYDDLIDAATAQIYA